MKIKLLFTIIVLSTFSINAQELPLETTNNKKKGKTKNSTFKSIVQDFENHFQSKSTEKKGSGYKPFKRWEYRWSHYLQKDGTIAPPKFLWEAWDKKRKMSKHAKVTSNWSSKGPFSQSSNSGQGRINTVAVDPNNSNIIYAGAPAGGLWKSIDNGINWIPLTDYLPQIGVSGIAIDKNNSNIIYISTGDDDAGDSYSVGVLKSTDGGNSWNFTGEILGNPTSSNEIVIDPNDSNKVWVATNNGLFLSTNAGNSWSRKLTAHIRDFKLKPNNPNTIYAVSSNTFYKSTNGGDNFSQITDGLPNSSSVGRLRVEVTPAAQNNVYVLAAKSPSQNWGFLGVYISTNNGNTFRKTNENNDIFNSSQAWYDLAFSVSDTNPNTIFVGVLDVWRSTNGGNNFIKINDWSRVNSRFTHADIHYMRYYNGILYAGTDGGIYKSTNNGNSFTDLTKTMSISQFYRIAVSKSSSAKLAGGLQDNGGFALSNTQWHNYHGGDGMDVASDPEDENTFYGFMQYGSSLARTTNGGVQGQFFVNAPAAETGSNDSGGNWVTPLVTNKSGEVYAGFSQLYKLENDSWTKISNHNFRGDIDNIEIDPNNSDNIFVSKESVLYKSTNKGKTFTTLTTSNTGLTGSSISSIEVHNSNSNIVWVTTSGTGSSQFITSGGTGGGVFKSIDGGLTFTNISNGLPNEAKLVVRHHPFSTNNSIYVGTALGVYHRNDDNDKWEVFSTNLPNVAVSDLEINPYDNTITAATYGRSIWQSSIPEISLPQNDADLAQITSPSGTTFCNGGKPTITVKNNGLLSINSLNINYKVDNQNTQTINWSGLIESNKTKKIELPIISVNGDSEHKIEVEIIQNNDENSFNNIITSKFYVNKSGKEKVTYTFGDNNPSENQNNSNWEISNDNVWQIGKPTTSDLNNLVNSGYVTNPNGNYPDQTVSYLISPCYNLSILENPSLKFKMAFDLEKDWDIIYMEYSTNQGADWKILGTANDPNWYNSNRTAESSGNVDCFNCPGAQWTGLNKTLKEYSYNLSNLNNESSIIFRFKFVSDQAVNEEGVVIDDFLIDATKVLSINDFEEGEFIIYPNPSSHTFHIKRKNTAGENMNITLYDIRGRLITKETNIIDENYKLNMNNVTKGVYFLQVSIGKKRLVKKLILN